jgi:hypothetical protein
MGYLEPQVHRIGPEYSDLWKIKDLMAGATGLEPATYGVTGRHSNQLSYAPAGASREGKPRERDGRCRAPTNPSQGRV